ncbi:MAG: TVP38/TMEM64 family protein [Dechloromonas sp.]|nr:MAG: TVP38/TMEM64 family protein [Dechloromonas sp.]
MMRSPRFAWLRMLTLIILLLVLIALALAWKAYVPADGQGIAALIDALRLRLGSLPAWLALAGVLLASIVAVPLGVIIVACALLFGPLPATAYVLAGATLGGMVSYGIGNYLGHDGLQRFAGERINRISRRLAERGLLSVILIRLLPIAPFAIVNMIAGASHLRLRDFVPGTLIGMLPGTLIIAFSVSQLQQWLAA